jgi:hypothetical protein
MVRFLSPRYRNVRAGELFELYIFAAISTVLLTRLILWLTGYPAIGNSTLHIAHVLWGGLLMMVSFAIILIFTGRRIQWIASIVGGVGFGLFIDELGKFVTHNNNYFFPRAIALIYVVFVGMFIWFRLIRRRKLSEREYLLNTIEIVQEAAIVGGLSQSERDQALGYLWHCNQSDPIVLHLGLALKAIELTPQKPASQWRHRKERLNQLYRHIIRQRYTTLLIDAIFIVKAVTFPIIVLTVLLGEPLFDANMAILQLISTIIAGSFVVAGVWKMRVSRVDAYVFFTKSLLVDIFLTQVFLFYRAAFAGSVMVVVNILLYVVLSSLIKLEGPKSSRGDH